METLKIKTNPKHNAYSNIYLKEKKDGKKVGS
jgi:hypothetical protein